MRGLLGPPRHLDLLALGSVWLAGAVEAVGCRRARRAAALVLAAPLQLVLAGLLDLAPASRAAACRRLVSDQASSQRQAALS